jgi:hypothetical protein
VAEAKAKAKAYPAMIEGFLEAQIMPPGKVID